MSKTDQYLAKMCERCPICARARKKQKGLAYWLVKNINSKVDPCCRAYERVHGKKSYEQ